MCEHVQATLEDWIRKQEDPDYQQRIQNLLINVPPGSMKSRVVSVCAPAWMWARWPEWRVICISANPRVALRDALFARDLIESKWYQETFRPEWKLTPDQNAKSNYRNTKGGFRLSFGFSSKITGDRADALIIDDPHDAEEVNSDAHRLHVLERWDNAIRNRVNDLRSSVRIGIMQRLHEEDWAGHVLAKGGWAHLCIPQEYEPQRYQPGARDYIPPVTPIGWSDPRTEPGELLFPERFTLEVLAAEKAELLDRGYAGQHQQRPAPDAGDFFKVSRIEIVDAAPAGLRKVRAWDLAATKGGGDWTTGPLMGVGADGIYYIEDVVRGQWASDERDAVIKQTAALDGKEVAILGPQDPGSAGVDTARAFVRMLAGYSVKTQRVTGSKETRAHPFASQVNAGNVKLVRGTWNRAFIDELRSFPNGSNDDQVDAASDAFAELALGGSWAQDKSTLEFLKNR